MVDIFDEVDAELKAERAQKLLVKYGAWMLAAALLVIAAAAGWQVWAWYDARYNRAMAAIYLDAMFAAEQPGGGAHNSAGTVASIDFTRVIRRGPDDYRTLARLQKAALEAKQGHETAAVAMWSAVVNDGAADPLLRDLARLLWVEHQLGSGNPQVLRERLAPLTAATNPWRSLALEASALLDMREGHNQDAKRVLQGLAQDITIPTNVRERAGALLQRLSG